MLAHRCRRAVRRLRSHYTRARRLSRVLVDVSASYCVLTRYYIRSCIAAAISIAISTAFIRAVNFHGTALLRSRTVAARDLRTAGSLIPVIIISANDDEISADDDEFSRQLKTALIRGAGPVQAEAVSGRPAAAAPHSRADQRRVAAVRRSPGLLPARWSILAVDIESFMQRTNPEKGKLCRIMYDLLDRALRPVGFHSRDDDPLNGRGGVLTLVLPSAIGYTASLGRKPRKGRLSQPRDASVGKILDPQGVGVPRLRRARSEANPGRSILRCKLAGEFGFLGRGGCCHGCQRPQWPQSHLAIPPGRGPRRSLSCDGLPVHASVVKRRSNTGAGKNRTSAAPRLAGQLEGSVLMPGSSINRQHQAVNSFSGCATTIN
jgi:hypothetical protein